MAGFEAIASQYVEADVSAVTFSSIPDTYEHLQLRLDWRGTYESTGIDGYIRFNSDSGSNYTKHMIYTASTGGTAVTESTTETTVVSFGTTGSSNRMGEWPVVFLTIFGYANSDVDYKPCFIHSALEKTAQYLLFGSSMWKNTDDIDTITVTTYGGNVLRGASMALYGWKSS